MRQFLLVFLLLAAGFDGAAARADKPNFPGIWGYLDTETTRAGKPWLKGTLLSVGWDDIEPKNGQFDWRPLDRKITEAAGRRGLYVQFLVYSGLQCPEWVYASGVPRVRSEAKKGNLSHPYYLDPRYKTYLTRMIRALASHVQTAYPADVRAKIISVQCPVGASGDPHPYKMPGNEHFGKGTKYEITRPAWDQFQRDMFTVYYNAFKTSKPRIFCLFNTNDSPEITGWALKALPGIWTKTGRIGDRHSNSGETRAGNPSSWLPPIIRAFQKDGSAVRARSEMDRANGGWARQDLVGNLYWTQLWGLHCGQDIHNQRPGELAKPAYYFAFDFYSHYAGYKDPRDSHGVWCALRDGLDAADKKRFPEATFGRTPAERISKVAAAFAPLGARQTGPPSPQTDWKNANDVGWDVFPGNYELWLSQIAPGETSVGLWHQGPKEQGFGLFARRFDHASGKDAMAFRIADGFFFGKPLAGTYPVTVRVVYLDSGTGTWALRYDGVSGPKTALAVTKTNTGRWKEAVATITDGHFGHRLERGAADLVLVNTDAEDDTFHQVELTRATGDRKGNWGTK